MSHEQMPQSVDEEMLPDEQDIADFHEIPGVGELKMARPDDGRPYELSFKGLDGQKTIIAVLGGKTPRAVESFGVAKAYVTQLGESFAAHGNALTEENIINGLREHLQERGVFVKE